MANEEHPARLKQGVAAWNQWREANPDIQPILTGADLREADLTEAHLFETDLQGANLNMANLHGADLSGANLTKACLFRANFTRAILSSANLTAAYLNGADLTEANLSVAKLERVLLVQTKFERANLTGCKVCVVEVVTGGHDLCHGRRIVRWRIPPRCSVISIPSSSSASTIWPVIEG